MKNIIYISTSVNLMDEDQLIGILQTARKNNAAHNISGVLLYSEGTFLQVLEGEDAHVDTIFLKIKEDKRHKKIILLIDEPIMEKNFSSWAMGFSSVNAGKTKHLIGYLTSADKLKAKDGNSTAITTLKTFIDTNKLPIGY